MCGVNAILLFYFVVIVSSAGCKSPVEDPPEDKNPPQSSGTYELVWNDEFNGTSLDLTKWNYETGTGVNGDFGTGQIDRATDRKENVSIVNDLPDAEGGCLAITTRKENYIDRNYTSGRINTSGKGSWGPGYKLVARIWANDIRYKGQGFAFWLMPAEKPADQTNIMWPQGGEVDIMEYVGSLPYHNLGSVHYAWSWNNNQYAEWNHGHKGAYYTYHSQDVPVTNPTYEGYVPQAGDTSAGSGKFHIYGIEWLADRMEFFIDGSVYHIHYFNDGAAFDNGVTDGQDEEGKISINGKRTQISEYSNHFNEWHPFEHSFFIILSAGVGGNDNRTYGGAIVPEAKFPCSVYVDWVRVYKQIQ
ncbi:MAG: glycoside hydrolase family 16 protein [Ignavibacteriales bacterium]|nr:glycoside hydrolase family 16 protein [Ignavibacteriales bacterium]